MKFQEALKYLLSPLQSMPPLKRLSLEKNRKSLAFSQTGRWKHSRGRTSASLSHRHNSSTECFAILCQLLISWQHEAVSGPRSACPLCLFWAMLLSSTTQPTVLTVTQQWVQDAGQGVPLLLGSPRDDKKPVCDPDLTPRGTHVPLIPLRVSLAHKSFCLRNSTYLFSPRRKEKKTKVSLFYSPTL